MASWKPSNGDAAVASTIDPRLGRSDHHRGAIRRRTLLSAAGAAIGIFGAPAILRGADAGKVFIRTTGGAAEEGFRRAWYEPFQKETGIEIVPVVLDAAKAVAMVRAGNVTADVINEVVPTMTLLAQQGALERIDYGRFSMTDPKDLDRYTDYWMAKSVYATVLGYNKEAFGARHPANWSEFWDRTTFPGRRMLQDASAEYPNLEQALLADGVPIDRLYPIDIDRAFRMMRAIKKDVAKWWESGAVAAQLLSDRVAVAGAIWDSRMTPLIKAGAPLSIEWNQAMRNPYGMGIVKGAPNRDLAYRAIDYGQSPKVQAAIAAAVFTAPSNRRAYEHLDQQVAQTLSTYPEHAKKGFVNNGEWWADNLESVRERWREFLLD